MAKQFKPETLCVQAGWTPSKGEPRVLPIYQSTTFEYDKVDKVRGMDIIFVTTANTDEEARELLTLMGAPFAK